ncbi:MAG: hypothetical protein K2J32_12355 [Ruminococcus sp.]|nr:hypothetical protein [Ruminococcus sp.]
MKKPKSLKDSTRETPKNLLDTETTDDNIKKIREEEKKELKEFKNSYKNILWIDDRDENNASKNPVKWLKDCLTNSDHMGIDLVGTIWEAVNKIQNCNQYDLVIFDMNLQNGFDDKKENSKNIENIFKDRNIDFNYNDVQKNPETAGIYLYVLLLSYGYPIDRMLIYTGNSENASLDENVKKKLAYFNFNNGIIKGKDKKLDLENTYFKGEKNSYYRVRRLVFQACDYWEKNIPETEKIKFNQLYFKNKKPNQIEKDSFIDMLDRAEMLFPVVKPVECEKVYYQALQVATMYHEQSAKINEIKKELQKFHSVSRYFRNFSAHSKFRNKIISADEFALIFCITLRTYFTDFSNELLPYEKNYFRNDEPTKIDYHTIINKWKGNLINNIKINTKNETPTDVSIEKIISHIAFQTEKILEPKDIMLVLFNDIIQNEKDENGKKIPIAFVKPQTSIQSKTSSCKIEFKYSINYTTAEPDNENFFMKYAYQLIKK